MTTKGGGSPHEPERPQALPPKAASADLGMLVDQLVKLGLEFAAVALPAVLTHAVKEDLGTLATCSWLREEQAILILGAPGVGKTHLAIALGVRAVESGFSVAFFRLEELLHAMRKDADVPPTRLRGKKYMKAGLVIIDEVGFETFTREEANLSSRLVIYRYQRGSLCVTSNKAIKDWPEMLAGDEVITPAILDRLLHSCHVLNIRGRIYRLRDLEDGLNGRS